MITHHPPLDLLVDYATGSQPEAVALAVATHVEACADCQRTVNQLDIIGGALLEDVEPAEISDGMLDSVFAVLDKPSISLPNQESVPTGLPEPFLPRVLVSYLNSAFKDLPWRRVGELFEEAILPVVGGGHRVSILRAQRGGYVPLHGHGGQEYLAVLSGGFRTNGEEFEKGDFAYCDESARHQPMIDTHDECICLLVLDAPLQFSGEHEKTLNSLFKM